MKSEIQVPSYLKPRDKAKALIMLPVRRMNQAANIKVFLSLEEIFEGVPKDLLPQKELAKILGGLAAVPEWQKTYNQFLNLPLCKKIPRSVECQFAALSCFFDMKERSLSSTPLSVLFQSMLFSRPAPVRSQDIIELSKKISLDTEDAVSFCEFYGKDILPYLSTKTLEDLLATSWRSRSLEAFLLHKTYDHYNKDNAAQIKILLEKEKMAKEFGENPNNPSRRRL